MFSPNFKSIYSINPLEIIALTKSYVVKSSINFANFGFFVRVGDILVHDTANGNRLTVYRGGEIVKAITQTALGMSALLKQNFISELTAHPVSAATAAPRASEAPKKASPASSKSFPSPPMPKVIPASREEADESRKEIKKKTKSAEEAPVEKKAPPVDEVEDL